MNKSTGGNTRRSTRRSNGRIRRSTRRTICEMIFLVAIIMIGFVITGMIDAGADAGIYPEKHSAHVEVIVTLDNGSKYIVDSYNKEVTVNTYAQPPENWEIAEW